MLASLLLLILATPHDSGPPRQDSTLVVTRVAMVMGTRLGIEIRGGDAAETAEEILREVERLDGLLSTWDTSSVMSRLNAVPVGTPTVPDADVLGLLLEADAWAMATGRAFEPVVGALVDAWDLRGRGRHPDAPSVAAALAATGPTAFRVDPVAGTIVRCRPGAWIDAGAFGKGAALRAVLGVLTRRAGGDPEGDLVRAFVDLGGQVLAWAAAPAARPWTVEVAHPRVRNLPVARLHVDGASAATSGDSERWIEVDGERFGHLLDPRTGFPAPAWGSVTVVAADPFVADVLSTALYVLGPEAGMAWVRDRTDIGALFLEERGDSLEARWNPAMERWLEPASISWMRLER